MNEPRSLFDKVWAAHEIVRSENADALLWVDRHYVHEGSFHAFAKMKEECRSERDGTRITISLRIVSRPIPIRIFASG